MSKKAIKGAFDDAQSSGLFGKCEFDTDTLAVKKDEDLFDITINISVKDDDKNPVDDVDTAKESIIEAFAEASENGAFEDITLSYDSTAFSVKQVDDGLFQLKTLISLSEEQEQAELIDDDSDYEIGNDEDDEE